MAKPDCKRKTRSDEFPLTLHKTGQYCKKIKGKLYYFGTDRKAALREFDTKWGLHELDIICYVPVKTLYSRVADGLVIGTGNTLGRLDLRLAEVMSLDLIHVCMRRKDSEGSILTLPSQAFIPQADRRT